MTNIVEKLRQAPVLSKVGSVTEPSAFSHYCADIFNQGCVDRYISWSPLWGYDLTEIPHQFHATFREAERLNEETQTDFRRAWVHLNQGILSPGSTFRIPRVHYDAYLEALPITTYPNNDVFVTSDSLPTRFFDQRFDLSECATANTSRNPNEVVIDALEEQVEEANALTPEPYDIIRYDSFAVHQAQTPTKPTYRTFMMVRFY